MTVSTSGARHLLLRLAEPARLPDAMLTALRDEVVLAGWMRASGVLSDVRVRVGTGSSEPRRIDGPVRVVTLEGSVGLASGDVSCGFRIVIARETDGGGFETIAGDLVEAKVNALEVHVTAFDDVVATRELDASGVWLLDATSSAAPAAAASAPAPVAPRPPAPAPVAAPAPPPAPAPVEPGFGAVVRANNAPVPVHAPAPTPAARPSPTFSANPNAMPARIAKPILPEEEDQAVPEPGDIVEHFAFGRCEVVKTDGDRLHVRLPKDQRVKEIALEMLKVSLLEPVEGQSANHYKLARKL